MIKKEQNPAKSKQFYEALNTFYSSQLARNQRGN
jgi:hypothetical protein